MKYKVNQALPFFLGSGDAMTFQFVYKERTTFEGTKEGTVVLDGKELLHAQKFDGNDVFAVLLDDSAYNLHLSCSGKFPGGYSEKGGSNILQRGVDMPLAAYNIVKFKNGQVYKVCSGVVNSANATATIGGQEIAVFDSATVKIDNDGGSDSYSNSYSMSGSDNSVNNGSAGSASSSMSGSRDDVINNGSGSTSNSMSGSSDDSVDNGIGSEKQEW